MEAYWDLPDLRTLAMRSPVWCHLSTPLDSYTHNPDSAKWRDLSIPVDLACISLAWTTQSPPMGSMGFSIKPARTMFDFWTALESCCDCGNVKLSAQVLPKSLTMALPTITPELAGQMVDKAGNSTLHQGVCALHHKQRSCNQSFFLSLSGPQTQELPLQLVPPNS